jgi:hypothetical protein
MKSKLGVSSPSLETLRADLRPHPRQVTFTKYRSAANVVLDVIDVSSTQHQPSQKIEGEQSGLSMSTLAATLDNYITPKVSNNAGRDHWSRAMCSLMAGGDVRTGQFIGETDDKAAGPIDKGFTPDDLATSFFRNIGIDPKTEYNANVGRPITLFGDGSTIPGLFN